MKNPRINPMAKTTKVSVQEFKAEPAAAAPTSEELKLQEYRKKMAEFAASADREIQRIAQTNGVRLGDTVIHEKSLCDAITAALEEHRDQYLELASEQ